MNVIHIGLGIAKVHHWNRCRLNDSSSTTFCMAANHTPTLIGCEREAEFGPVCLFLSDQLLILSEWRLFFLPVRFWHSFGFHWHKAYISSMCKDRQSTQWSTRRPLDNVFQYHFNPLDRPSLLTLHFSAMAYSLEPSSWLSVVEPNDSWYIVFTGSCSSETVFPERILWAKMADSIVGTTW